MARAKVASAIDDEARRRRAARATLVVLACAVAGAQAPAEPARTPEAALARLKAGNARFVGDPSAISNVSWRAEAGNSVSPIAAVVSCADALVPPEVVFSTGPGELFVVRSAGHAVDRVVLGSLEYAVERLQVPLLVVMGHESCPTVSAAIGARVNQVPGSTNYERLLASISPAFDRLSAPADIERLRDAILANVEQSVNDLLTGSESLRSAVAAGGLHVVGAYHERASGHVRFSNAVTAPLPAAPAAPSTTTR